jgi:N-acetylglutamate synthase-like GNAT family acetyltransferase
VTNRPVAAGVVALPLATWERDGMKAALAKAQLPVDDIEAPGRFFWRFEQSYTPVGFGGLEIHGPDALLRSVVTLPPVRGRGIGAAIVAMLETEASIAGCRTAWLLTVSATPYFEKLGYETRDRAAVPEAIRASAEFTALCPADATAMAKPLA